MTDRHIIFSAPMIRALLDGRKTQTRRLVRSVPVMPASNCHPHHKQKHPAPYLDSYCGEKKTAANPRGMSDRWCWWQVDDRQCLPTFRVPFVPGDRLWVREAWAKVGDQTVYRAGHAEATASGPRVDERWRSPIHMPRRLSRITLVVEDVSVERVQEISDEDAAAEGVKRSHSGGPWGEEGLIEDFAGLWNSIHGPDAWERNDWVVAIRFRVVFANNDRVEQVAG